MHTNGFTHATKEDKETSDARLERYLVEFRRKARQEAAAKTTGHLCLTINMREGSFFQRQVIVEEVGK